jgi:hypothetical protein
MDGAGTQAAPPEDGQRDGKDEEPGEEATNGYSKQFSNDFQSNSQAGGYELSSIDTTEC